MNTYHLTAKEPGQCQIVSQNCLKRIMVMMNMQGECGHTFE